MTLTNYYSTQETPSYTSIDNSLESSLPNPTLFSDGLVDNSFDINDAYLTDYSCPDPWHDTIGDYVLEDTSSSPNRIALPRQVYPIVVSPPHENNTEIREEESIIKRKPVTLVRKKKKDDDDEYEADMSESKTTMKKEKLVL